MTRIRWVCLYAFMFCLIPWSPAAEEINFVVLDPQELPVAGAAVEVRSNDTGSYSQFGKTDQSGRVSFSVALPAIVHVQAPGFKLLTRKIVTAGQEDIRLILALEVFQVSIDVVVQDTPEPDSPIERSALVIERSGARTVYDALDKLIPSANVPSKGILGHGLGQSNSLTLRGMGGSPTTQLLIVVDGRPDVMGLMGHPLPDFYSLTDVGTLSITPGPASVLYGNRAMGGVIEVKPVEPEPGFHTELTASLGSYYTGQDQLSHGGQFGKFQYHFAGGIEHTNGHRENSAFRNKDGILRLAYNLDPAWKATLDGRYGHFHVEDPGTVEAPFVDNWARVGRGGYSIGLENSTERSRGSMRFFSSYGHHMLSDGFRSVDENLGFRALQTFTIGSGLEFDVGGDVARYGGRANNILRSIDYGEHHVTEGGGFGRLRWNAAKGLRLNTGFRYDDNSVFGGVAAAEFGASYAFAPNYTLSIAIARGFRNPTIRELYLFPAPTPTLEPERVWNYQASFQFRPVPRFLSWITGYYSDVDNLIVTTGMYPNLSLQNTGRASNRGLEINGRLRVNGRINVYSAYAWFDSNNPALYVPANKWIYSMDVDLVRAFITFGGRTVGRTWANTSRTVQLDGYTVATLRCTVPLGRHWSVFASVDNLFDQEYEELAGYPMPGVNAAGGFRVRL